MTTQELKQQAHKEFDEKCKEVEFLHGVPVDLPNYYREKIKSFLDSIIDRTIQHEHERIVGVVTKLQEDGLNVQIEGDYYINFRDLESLITNKSDINK